MRCVCCVLCALCSAASWQRHAIPRGLPPPLSTPPRHAAPRDGGALTPLRPAALRAGGAAPTSRQLPPHLPLRVTPRQPCCGAEQAALCALRLLWSKRSKHDLVGNTLDVATGRWRNPNSGIGAGIDSRSTASKLPGYHPKARDRDHHPPTRCGHRLIL